MEWLATGKDPIGWDAQRLREVVEAVEDGCGEAPKITPREKAELISLIYEEIAEQESKQMKQPAEPRPARILRLVEKIAA